MTRFGAPDVVIANAGISRGTVTGHREDLDDFRAVFDTNVLGLVHTFHAFLAPMRERRSGAFVGIASVAGFRGLPGSGAYSASKSAAITYLESLRIELRSSGIAVVTVCPGYIATPMTEHNPYPMPFLLRCREGCTPHRTRDRAPQAVLRAAVADGAGRQGDALRAAAAVRRGVRSRAAKAAPHGGAP